MNAISLVALLLAAVSCTVAYRHGAPQSACHSLTPRHGHARPQTDEPPYSLELTRDTSTPDWSIRVTLKGNREQNTFQGFLVQAREDSSPIGHFTVLEEFSDISQLLRCSKDGDSITHKIIENPANEVAFQWTAPQNFTRPFRFHFTVARSKHTFWADETQDVEFRGADNFV